MKDLGLDKTEKWEGRFKMNGYSLILSFFLFRVVFLGVLLIMYVIPTMANYDYVEADKNVGWFKISFFERYIMQALYVLIYVLNIFWFYQLIAGAIKFIRNQGQPSQSNNESKHNGAYI